MCPYTSPQVVPRLTLTLSHDVLIIVTKDPEMHLHVRAEREE